MTKQGLVISEPIKFVKKGMFVAVVEENDESILGFGRVESYKRQGHAETICWVASNTDNVDPKEPAKEYEVNYFFPQSRLRQFLISEKNGGEEPIKYLLKFNQWKSALLNGEVGTGKLVNFATYQRFIPEEKQREGGPKYIEFARVLPDKRDPLSELILLRNEIDAIIMADNISHSEGVFLKDDKLNLDQIINTMYKMKEPGFQATDLVSAITKNIVTDSNQG